VTRAWLIAGSLLAAASGNVSAACRDDLIKADQNFAQTRSALQSAASAAPAVKCAAYRRHVASLTEVRKVFARCDTGADKAKNAAQTTAALAEFTRQMRASCKQ
jgi:hypothetical protein